MKSFILKELTRVQNDYSFCAVVDHSGRIYPLGSDTKVISALFEIEARRAVATYAAREGLLLVEPTKQNHYPDFTLMRSKDDKAKIALDVKTTYRNNSQDQFRYTLGSYTSYIRLGTESKNIVFPYSEYSQHWIIGFVYERTSGKRDTSRRTYSFDALKEIPKPLDNVEVFMQEKWKIAGDKAGSGNTANIGSIRGTITDFKKGNGVFNSETEFLEYWRGYQRTEQERQSAYSNIQEFRRKNK